MAKTILANPDDLIEKSKQVRQLKNRHIDAMNHITNIVMTLGEVWQGEAQNAFVSKYLSMQPVYDSFQEALEEFAVLMEHFANDMKTADQEGKQQLAQIGPMR